MVPLEYACHVRDVLLTHRERVLLVRRRMNVPEAVPMGRAERAMHDGYVEQDPIEIAQELTMAARLLTNVLGQFDPADWELRLVYNWPGYRKRTLRWVAAHTLHDVHHHLLDAHRQLRQTVHEIN